MRVVVVVTVMMIMMLLLKMTCVTPCWASFGIMAGVALRQREVEPVLCLCRCSAFTRNLDFGSFVDGLPILELPELLGGLGCSLSGQKVQS
jgi:hypothetical protein